MYGWIWRHLPFGLPGKIIGSLLLIGGVVALLWYIVFPAVEPILPFDDVQVEPDQPGGDTVDDSNPTDPAPGDGASGQPDDGASDGGNGDPGIPG